MPAMPREMRFVVLAMVVAGLLVYFALPALGYSLKPWALILFTSLAAFYAGLLVFLGENIIEDFMKSGIMLILTGILWFQTPKSGFLFICALAAAVVGTLLNQVCRATRK